MPLNTLPPGKNVTRAGDTDPTTHSASASRRWARTIPSSEGVVTTVSAAPSAMLVLRSAVRMSVQSLAAAIVTMLALVAAPAVAGAQVRSFGDWTVACDQTLTCEAVNVSDAFAARTAAADPPDLPGGFGLMRVERAGAADAPAILTVTFNVWDEVRLSLPQAGVTLHVSDAADEDRTGRAYPLQSMGFGRYRLPDGQLAGFLKESGRSGMAAVRRPDGELYGLLTTRGLAATLRYIDETQGRVGTAGALVAKTGKPGPRLAGGPPVPVVRTRPAFQGALIRDPDLAVLRERYCGGERPASRPIEAESWRLAGGPLLIAVPCVPDGGATLWILRYPYGDEVLTLPLQNGEDDMVGLLGDGKVDSARGLLTMIQVSRGFGDCGTLYTWGWTGTAFQLVEVKVMGPCLGYLSREWLTTYRARVVVGS
jgi:hypothetical protein